MEAASAKVLMTLNGDEGAGTSGTGGGSVSHMCVVVVVVVVARWMTLTW